VKITKKQLEAQVKLLQTRLDFLSTFGGRISWSRDREVCNVWIESDEESEPAKPAEGYPQKCYHDPAEAIDAAIKHLKFDLYVKAQAAKQNHKD
jgi:hypothetical protein